MKINTKLLFIAVVVALALPLVLTVGDASAAATDRYLSDGAVPNGTTGGWNLPADQGTCAADTTKTSRPTCNAISYPAYTTTALCSTAPGFPATATWRSACLAPSATSQSACLALPGNPIWGHLGSGSDLCTISMLGQDRNATTCVADGGVYQLTCVANFAFTGTYTGNDQCLRCHNSTGSAYVSNVAAATGEGYLKTGHKNMLRKVSAPNKWADGGGFVYTTLLTGQASPNDTATVNWATGTISTVSSLTNAQLLYIYGDWMGAETDHPGASVPNAIWTTNGTTASGYSCASCHTTGYNASQFDTTVTGPSGKIREPKNSYPLITSGITGSWDYDGIICARCHNATSSSSYVDNFRAQICGTTGVGNSNCSVLVFGTHNGGTNLSDGATSADPNTNNAAKVIGLCFECHNSTITKADPAGQIKVGANHGAANGDWNGHVIGNMMLNGTHAKFTGTAGQIKDVANYASNFSRPSSSPDGFDQAGCVGCHNVHQSTVEAVGAEGIEQECTACHNKSLPGMNHPTGADTPANGNLTSAAACESCHMWRNGYCVSGTTVLPAPASAGNYYNENSCAANGGTWTEGLPSHVWRINTDASYSTFPTAAQWVAGTRKANTAADGTYANAVWGDLDLACGKCHGGSQGTDGKIAAAPYFDKATLANYAKNIHNDMPVAKFSSTPDSTTSKKVNFNASGSVCPSLSSCTYAWDFGDTTTGTGVTTNHVYADTTTRTVTLTVTGDDGSDCNTTKDSTSKSVTPVILNTPPVVGITGLTFTNLTVSFTDASTDDGVGGAATVYVNWGDGSPVAACGATGSVCTKTYAAAGTYNITHYVRDAGGLLSANDTFQAIVPAKFFVNVSTTAAVQSALVQVKQGLAIKAQGYTSVAGTWQSLVKLPTGAYTATITKAGVTFDCDVAVGIQNPVSFSIVAADVNINCTH